MENLEKNLDALTRKLYGRPIGQVTNAELYQVLLQLTKDLKAEKKEITGSKKI